MYKCIVYIASFGTQLTVVLKLKGIVHPNIKILSSFTFAPKLCGQQYSIIIFGYQKYLLLCSVEVRLSWQDDSIFFFFWVNCWTNPFILFYFISFYFIIVVAYWGKVCYYSCKWSGWNTLHVFRPDFCLDLQSEVVNIIVDENQSQSVLSLLYWAAGVDRFCSVWRAQTPWFKSSWRISDMFDILSWF